MTHHIAGLFVYNPTLGHEFSEGEKILAFYPNIDFDLQKQHVGLCEGLFSFTRDFSVTLPLDYIQTEQHHIGIFSPEKDYFLVLLLHKNLYRTSDDGENYYDDDIDDDFQLRQIFQNTLQDVYSLFITFNDTFQAVQQLESYNGLRDRLTLFLSYIIPLLPTMIFGVSPLNASHISSSNLYPTQITTMVPRGDAIDIALASPSQNKHLPALYANVGSAATVCHRIAANNFDSTLPLVQQPRILYNHILGAPFQHTMNSSVANLNALSFLTLRYFVTSLHINFPQTDILCMFRGNTLVFSQLPSDYTRALFQLKLHPILYEYLGYNALLRSRFTPDAPPTKKPSYAEAQTAPTKCVPVEHIFMAPPGDRYEPRSSATDIFLLDPAVPVSSPLKHVRPVDDVYPKDDLAFYLSSFVPKSKTACPSLQASPSVHCVPILDHIQRVQDDLEVQLRQQLAQSSPESSSPVHLNNTTDHNHQNEPIVHVADPKMLSYRALKERQKELQEQAEIQMKTFPADSYSVITPQIHFPIREHSLPNLNDHPHELAMHQLQHHKLLLKTLLVYLQAPIGSAEFLEAQAQAEKLQSKTHPHLLQQQQEHRRKLHQENPSLHEYLVSFHFIQTDMTVMLSVTAEQPPHQSIDPEMQEKLGIRLFSLPAEPIIEWDDDDDDYDDNNTERPEPEEPPEYSTVVKTALREQQYNNFNGTTTISTEFYNDLLHFVQNNVQRICGFLTPSQPPQQPQASSNGQPQQQQQQSAPRLNPVHVYCNHNTSSVASSLSALLFPHPRSVISSLHTFSFDSKFSKLNYATTERHLFHNDKNNMSKITPYDHPSASLLYPSVSRSNLALISRIPTSSLYISPLSSSFSQGHNYLSVYNEKLIQRRQLPSNNISNAVMTPDGRIANEPSRQNDTKLNPTTAAPTEVTDQMSPDEVQLLDQFCQMSAYSRRLAVGENTPKLTPSTVPITPQLGASSTSNIDRDLNQVRPSLDRASSLNTSGLLHPGSLGAPSIVGSLEGAPVVGVNMDDIPIPSGGRSYAVSVHVPTSREGNRNNLKPLPSVASPIIGNDTTSSHVSSLKADSMMMASSPGGTHVDPVSTKTTNVPAAAPQQASSSSSSSSLVRSPQIGATRLPRDPYGSDNDDDDYSAGDDSTDLDFLHDQLLGSCHEELLFGMLDDILVSDDDEFIARCTTHQSPQPPPQLATATANNKTNNNDNNNNNSLTSNNELVYASSVLPPSSTFSFQLLNNTSISPIHIIQPRLITSYQGPDKTTLIHQQYMVNLIPSTLTFAYSTMHQATSTQQQPSAPLNNYSPNLFSHVPIYAVQRAPISYSDMLHRLIHTSVYDNLVSTTLNAVLHNAKTLTAHNPNTNHTNDSAQSRRFQQQQHSMFAALELAADSTIQAHSRTALTLFGQSVSQSNLLNSLTLTSHYQYTHRVYAIAALADEAMLSTAQSLCNEHIFKNAAGLPSSSSSAISPPALFQTPLLTTQSDLSFSNMTSLASFSNGGKGTASASSLPPRAAVTHPGSPWPLSHVTLCDWSQLTPAIIDGINNPDVIRSLLISYIYGKRQTVLERLAAFDNEQMKTIYSPKVGNNHRARDNDNGSDSDDDLDDINTTQLDISQFYLPIELQIDWSWVIPTPYPSVMTQIEANNELYIFHANAQQTNREFHIISATNIGTNGLDLTPDSSSHHRDNHHNTHPTGNLVELSSDWLRLQKDLFNQMFCF